MILSPAERQLRFFHSDTTLAPALRHGQDAEGMPQIIPVPDTAPDIFSNSARKKAGDSSVSPA